MAFHCCSEFLLTLVIFYFLDGCVFGHDDHNEELVHKLQTLKDKWDVVDVIRDPEHIKDDLKNLLDLSRNQTISPDETYFYFIRMHDFDDNDGLDGIEIFHAMQHVYEHYNVNSTDMTTEMLVEHVDNMLKDDSNVDGFLTYAEYKRAADDRHQAMLQAQEAQQAPPSQ